MAIKILENPNNRLRKQLSKSFHIARIMKFLIAI